MQALYRHVVYESNPTTIRIAWSWLQERDANPEPYSNNVGITIRITAPNRIANSFSFSAPNYEPNTCSYRDTDGGSNIITAPNHIAISDHYNFSNSGSDLHDFSNTNTSRASFFPNSTTCSRTKERCLRNPNNPNSGGSS